MHLMYTLDESGNRVYTLKVFLLVLHISTFFLMILLFLFPEINRLGQSHQVRAPR